MTAPAWAYVEVHPDERAATCALFLARAAAFFAASGSAIEQVMTERALAYRRSGAFAAALAALGARHLVIAPYRPQLNGKVCVSAWLPPPDGAARLTRTLAA